MTIRTHLKITFVITFLGGLIYWNLLNFSCDCKDISSFEVVPGYFLLSLGKIQLLENHLLRDEKLTLNQSPSRLGIWVTEMLTQRRKVFGCLNNTFQYLLRMYLTFSLVILFYFYISHTKKLCVMFH